MDYQDRVQWVIEELDSLLEDFTGKAKPGSRPGSLKRKAAQYLGKGAGDKLSKTDLKNLRAKANHLKKSSKKSERDRGNQLAKQVNFAYNFKVAEDKQMKLIELTQQKALTEEQFDEKAGEKDACYHKVKSRYKVWPSAYASGALTKCRKVGAANWGKSKK